MYPGPDPNPTPGRTGVLRNSLLANISMPSSADAHRVLRVCQGTHSSPSYGDCLNFASSFESLIEKKWCVSLMNSDPTPSRTGVLRNRFCYKHELGADARRVLRVCQIIQVHYDRRLRFRFGRLFWFTFSIAVPHGQLRLRCESNLE
jgi:hypothetical protein